MVSLLCQVFLREKPLFLEFCYRKNDVSRSPFILPRPWAGGGLGWFFLCWIPCEFFPLFTPGVETPPSRAKILFNRNKDLLMCPTQTTAPPQYKIIHGICCVQCSFFTYPSVPIFGAVSSQGKRAALIDWMFSPRLIVYPRGILLFCEYFALSVIFVDWDFSL